MKSIDFLSPRLTGERFRGHAIPLDVLGDLAVLKDMVIEVAKAKFLEDHPGRQRSPRGFTEGLDLKLTSVEEGSTIAVITLVVSTDALMPPDHQHYFEQARDSIIAAIASADQQPERITEYLPEKALGYFDRFGRSLQKDEAIEFDREGGLEPARLTKETRRRLILASSAVQEVTEEALIRGLVPEFDQEKKSFEIQLADERRIKARVGEPHFDLILEAFNGYREGLRIAIHGIGRFSRTNKLLGLDEIHHLSILDPLDIPARLDELRYLEDGWIEGRGIAPSHEGLEWLEQVFTRSYPDELPLPYLYPSEDGGMQAEWSLRGREITLEVDLRSHVAQWHSLDLESDQEEERELHLGEPDAWKWIELKVRDGSST